MRALTGTIPSYDAPSNEEIRGPYRRRDPGHRPVRRQHVPGVLPSHTAEALAEELARVNTYPHGGYPRLERAIADYAGVAPENVVLGAGADDLILLTARSFAGRGERIAIANDPTYPLFEIAARLSGAESAGQPVADDPLPAQQSDGGTASDPGRTAARRRQGVLRVLGGDRRRPHRGRGRHRHPHLLEGVRTRGRANRLRAGGPRDRGRLNHHQNPAPVSTLTAALAIAALEDPPDVQPILHERERFASRLGELGLDPWPSCANFLYVPADDPTGLGERLLRHGLAVRPVRGGIRVTIGREDDDERLLAALATELSLASNPHTGASSRSSPPRSS